MKLEHPQLSAIMKQPRHVPVVLLCGSEPALLLAWKKALHKRLEEDGAQLERLHADGLDVESLCANAQMIAFFGGFRVFSVEDLDPEALSEAECRMLCELFAAPPVDTMILVVCRADAYDEKKGKRAKKLGAAAAKHGKVIRLDRMSFVELKAFARDRCARKGCRISDADAALVAQRCNGDLGILVGDCDKICAYAMRGNAVTAAMIEVLCQSERAGDLYGLAHLILQSKTADALLDIDRLLLSKEPAARILGSLGIAFSDLYKAACARKEKKTARDMFRDLGFRFEWQADPAFRDSASVDEARLLAVCEVFHEADLSLKSGVGDERALLDAAVIRAGALLRGLFI